MPKPTKRARLDAIRACLERHGPLYVAALYPLDALDHQDEYVPWFISHTDEKALRPERIQRLWVLAAVSNEATFAHWPGPLGAL